MTCGTLDHWAYKEKVFAFDTWHLPVSQDLTWGSIIALHIAWHWCHTLHHVLSIFPLFFFHVHVLSYSLLCACDYGSAACVWSHLVRLWLNSIFWGFLLSVFVICCCALHRSDVSLKLLCGAENTNTLTDQRPASVSSCKPASPPSAHGFITSGLAGLATTLHWFMNGGCRC